MLKDKVDILHAKNIEVGWDEGDEVVYEPMKVRDSQNKLASTMSTIGAMGATGAMGVMGAMGGYGGGQWEK